MIRNTIIIISLCLLFSACLEENIQPVDIPFNNSRDILNYVESNGNFINSDENPSLIDVDDVNTNLANYRILDIRNSLEFNTGHIPAAVNIDAIDVLDYLDTLSTNFSKIIIVSKSGQKAAYVTSLLRIIGFSNLYSLDYGMGYWHDNFSDIWAENKKNSIFGKTYYRLRRKVKTTEELFNNYVTPEITFSDENEPIKNKIRGRVKKLIEQYEFSTNITIEQFDSKFNTIPPDFGYSNTFLICYDHELQRGLSPLPPLLFNAYAIFPLPFPPFKSPGIPYKLLYYTAQSTGSLRPLGTFLYNGEAPEYDFYSGNKLFTIPTDQEIIIYSYNGQRSAYITAYLNLLGYDAKFVLFGAHSMLSNYYISREIHGRADNPKVKLDTIYYRSPFSKYAFWEENIRNYPIEVGP